MQLAQFPDSLIKLDSLPIWRHLHLFLLLNTAILYARIWYSIHFFHFLNRKKRGGRLFLLQQVFLATIDGLTMGYILVEQVHFQNPKI